MNMMNWPDTIPHPLFPIPNIVTDFHSTKQSNASSNSFFPVNNQDKMLFIYTEVNMFCVKYLFLFI